MKAVRKTVDMIAVFHRGEPPEPIKFRYERDDGREYEIRIDKVVDLRAETYGSAKNYIYRCQSLMGRRERVYEIRYLGGEARWELYKI